MLTNNRVIVRDYLRDATRENHDALDSLVTRTDLCDPQAYEPFLQFQHAARLPFEEWCQNNAPADLRPPRQTGLIRADLAELGSTVAKQRADMPAIDSNHDPLAIAWVLAGSALGNRSILSDLRRRSGETMPTNFLDDNTMFRFWRDLKPALQQSVDIERARRMAASARCVFDLFLAEAKAGQITVAA